MQNKVIINLKNWLAQQLLTFPQPISTYLFLSLTSSLLESLIINQSNLNMEVEKQQPDSEAKNILTLMKESKIYWTAKREIMTLILKNRTTSPPTIEDLHRALLLSGNEEKITGIINNCLQKSTRRLPIEKDPNPDIEPYRLKWSEMITKEFNSMSNKISRQEEYDEEDESVTYIYDCSSLLEFLSSVKAKISFNVRDSPIFIFPTEVLKVSKYTQIRQKFIFLNNPENIIGGQLDNDLRDRQKRAKKIVEGETIASEIESFLCLGCINGERVNVYRRYFQCFYEYTGKRVEFSLYQKIWKHMIKSDSKEILKNPVYFVFKEAILKVYETFICDKQLGQMVKIRQTSPIEIKLDKFAPIHGSLPSKCFANYIAPFCFTSTSTEEVYQLFRQIYANYLILLNTVSSLPDSILSLCVLFEQILWSTEKKLVAKFEQLQIQPLRIVFPWMFYCFIGYVNVEQFFLLFDRIVGSKSMEIIPLYCVSLLFKEKEAIMEAKSQSQIEQILEESMYDDFFLETIRQFFKFHL